MMLEFVDEEPEPAPAARRPARRVLSSACQEGALITGEHGVYQVLSSDPIGTGTSGSVYAAKCMTDGERVAVKVIDR
jgi:predicted unusual protein kinase regulating ubiquinone biosynthesis (AarF/ABC1/UbiB family)